MKVLIVDDEPLARERLLRLVAKLLPDCQCQQVGDGEAALQCVAESAPDLILLDIRMPGMDGIEVATRVGELEEPPAIIFCTAYDEYALEALKQQALDYLLKPVREADLSRALGNAGRVNRLQMAALNGESEAGRRQVSSHTHRGLETMAVDQVRCFVAEHKYVTAIGSGQQLVLPDTLKELEQEFAGSFVRVHRNALVALAHIERLQRAEDGSWVVELAGIDMAPAVSRRHLSEVKQALVAR